MKRLFLLSSLLFAFTIFLGSFLLFQIQPLIGKYLLPWFGGSAFVWTTALLFFQVALLAGYFYTYLLTKLPRRWQVGLHTLLLLGCGSVVIFLFPRWIAPIFPPFSFFHWQPISPVLQVLWVLICAIALPYFLLSTTSTLLQKWFSFLGKERSSYFLYALSNTGSLLGLVSYPFLIEPLFSLRSQGYLWSVVLLLYIILFFVCCIFIFFSHSSFSSSPTGKYMSSTPVVRWHYLLWIVFPAISSLMLLATTNRMLQSIAPIPFLWIIPLGLYLISFIICFSSSKFYLRNMYATLFLVLLPLISAWSISSINLGVTIPLGAYSVLLFCCFMLCHGEVYSFRPSPSQLNLFYLFIAIGSAIGACIVALIAPVFFTGLFWEFYIGLLLSCGVALFVLFFYKDSLVYSFLLTVLKSKRKVLLFTFTVWSVFFLICFSANYYQQVHANVGIWRNPYATLRVAEYTSGGNSLYCILNGVILHGCQYRDPSLSHIPLTYYGETSGIGLTINAFRQQNHKQLRLGVIGLGAGTLAAYGQKGDFIHFYELDPQDVTVASSYFRYLKDSPSDISVSVGDGRLLLQKEISKGGFKPYDILVVDAFSDDAIPIHLLTKEAFALYLRALAPDGVIAFHVSTTYIDLYPVLKQMTEYFGLESAFVYSSTRVDSIVPSKWVLLTHNNLFLQKNDIAKAKKTSLKDIKDISLWTDDYSNLFQVLNY
jgi:hypothetical protein